MLRGVYHRCWHGWQVRGERHCYWCCNIAPKEFGLTAEVAEVAVLAGNMLLRDLGASKRQSLGYKEHRRM